MANTTVELTVAENTAVWALIYNVVSNALDTPDGWPPGLDLPLDPVKERELLFSAMKKLTTSYEKE